ncbi:MAG: hypothetical protein CMC26_00620 [Flavobacteriaceae bacterium]|nr:hypothetical protein [Flavobacteriaceae bacterium]|tara:strand:+ start:1205 stop:2956 length:1752 start_codon:yes stop_codon:yes gene_type:complete
MKYNLFKISVFTILLFIVSCGDIDSIHEQYLQGEQVYAGKLDTLEVKPGYYRAQLEGQTQFLGNSNQIIIEYDDQTDIYDINEDNFQNGIYKLILPELEEKSYEFTVTTQDEIGNLSVSQIVAGFAIGDIFVSDQDPREIIDFSFESDGTYANFYGNAQSENVIYTLVDYENEQQQITRDTVFFDDSKLRLQQFKPEGILNTTSVIQSGLNGIDSIELAPLNYVMPDLPYTELNKNYMSLVNMPSDNPGTYNNANPQEYLFDDITSWNGDDTFTYNSGPSSIPSHFTVDLGVMTTLRRVDINMIDPVIDSSSNPTNVQIWGRDNLLFAETPVADDDDFINSGWVLLHEEQINGSTSNYSSFIVEPLSSLKRFIRIKTTSSVNNQSVKITELSFFGENIAPVELDKGGFSIINMPSDNPGTAYGANPSLYLFDNNSFYSGDEFGYHSGENAVPGHFTIDLGTSTYLQKLNFEFRPTWSFNGNTPTQIEIWSRSDLENAETGSNFEILDNEVISEPTSTEELIAANWTLIHSSNLDGQNISNAELEINSEITSKFIKIRYVNTVGESACQIIEISALGFGSFVEN